MDDKIEYLEKQLQGYMSQFCDLVSKSAEIDSDKTDVSKIAHDLRQSHRKMVEIVDGMKFLEETEEDLYKQIKSYEMKNQSSLCQIKFTDNHIGNLGQEVEFSLAAISNLK